MSPAWRVSLDPGDIDLDVVHRFLSEEAYWCRGVPREVVAEALRHSVVAGARADGAQVGFARAVTDRATFAYLADVFVLPAWRGQGIARGLVGALLGHPDLQGLRRWALVTADAHPLYRGLGFEALANPERWMERHDPQAYRR